MIATNENKYVSSYWYDADGNRTVKMHGSGTAAYVNGKPLARGTNAYDHYTLYASPYFSITDDSLYAHHVYMGGERIMTLVGRLGSRFGSYGSADAVVVDSSLASPNVNYMQKFVKMKNRIRLDFDSLGVAYKYGNPSSVSKNTGYVQQAQLPSLDGLSGLGGIRADDGSRSPDGTGSSDVDDGTEPGNWQREDGSIFDEQDAVIPDETEEEEVSPSDSEDSGSDSEEDMDGLSRRELMVMAFEPLQDAEAAYYYHKDHLGSSSIITNENGEVTQRIEYLPYGEVFLEQKNENWNTSYKFNGKEYDEETGLYYYGAHYYDPRLSLWLGTDPMQGKYPGISTYAYCMGNPVNAVDVDGKKSYLIIWTSDAYHYGHAAFAIDNYKYDSQSKKMVPNGTLTSYSLFPIGIYSITQTIRDEKVRGLFLVSRNVSLNAIRNNEYNSGEDYKPDGIIEINSDYILDTEAKRHMESEIQSHKGYRGRSRNCSTFAREGVKKATGKDVNGEERSLLIFNYVTPNKLFQDTKKMQNTNVLKDPGGKENNTFVPF